MGREGTRDKGRQKSARGDTKSVKKGCLLSLHDSVVCFWWLKRKAFVRGGLLFGDKNLVWSSSRNSLLVQNFEYCSKVSSGYDYQQRLQRVLLFRWPTQPPPLPKFDTFSLSLSTQLSWKQLVVLFTEWKSTSTQIKRRKEKGFKPKEWYIACKATIWTYIILFVLDYQTVTHLKG